MHSISEQEYLASCCDIARRAGQLIMTHYQAGGQTRHKQDNSPVTDADVEANRLITQALSAMSPHIPVVAEEDENPAQEGHARFWLVDPLDGTRAFVAGEPEFTVNIGLIENSTPALGVIYLPPLDLLYFGGPGIGVWRQTGADAPTVIAARKVPAEGVTVVKSKSHPSRATQAYLDKLKIAKMLPGSSSIKFCQIAEGAADIYPRFGRTMEWDTAAGHAILLAAGGRVETVDGKPLGYGKPTYENPSFIAFGA